MPTTLIYHCEIDFHRSEEWPAWAENVRSSLLAYHADQFRYQPSFEIEIHKDPVFIYGSSGLDPEKLNEQTKGMRNRIVIQNWSTIVFYSSIAVIVSDNLDLLEVKRRLSYLFLLNEYKNRVDTTFAKLKLYRIDPILELKLRQLINGSGNFVYLTGWYPDEPNEQDWIIHREVRDHFDIHWIHPKNDRHDFELWRASLNNQMLAVQLSSSFLDAMTLVFEDYDDLLLFLGKWRMKEPIISLNRNHMDDQYIALYNMSDFDTGGVPYSLFI